MLSISISFCYIYKFNRLHFFSFSAIFKTYQCKQINAFLLFQSAVYLQNRHKSTLLEHNYAFFKKKSGLCFQVLILKLEIKITLGFAAKN